MALRRRIQVIFQDPYSSLNPRMKVGDIIAEPMKVHGIEPRCRRDARRGCASCCRSAASIRTSPTAIRTRCRAASASGSASPARWRSIPEFIVCDEAVSALDVSIQAQVVNLLEDLRERFGLTYLFIAHDLSVVRHLCQRVAVMYLGRIVELAECDELFDNPLHPYTQALLVGGAGARSRRVEAARAFRPVKGEVPSPINPPSGCVFHPRCPIAVDGLQAGAARIARTAARPLGRLQRGQLRQRAVTGKKERQKEEAMNIRSGLAAAGLGLAATHRDAAARWHRRPKRGGTLTYMIPADAPPSFDGHRETTFATVHAAAPFYSVLIRVNPDNPSSTTDFVCDLCTEMPKPTDDGKTYTFKIREGVKFHDGIAADRRRRGGELERDHPSRPRA